MNIFDIILIIILAYFIFKGARVGFVKLIGGFIGIILGAWMAGQYYDEGADFLLYYFDIDSIMAAIVASFIIIFIAVVFGVGIVVDVITRVFKIVPFATFFNRLIGAALGLLEGLILIGLIIWIITLFPFTNAFTQKLEESKVALYVRYSAKLVQPLLPEGLRQIDVDLLRDLKDFTDEKAQYLEQNMPRFFDRIKQEKERIETRMEEEIELNKKELGQ